MTTMTDRYIVQAGPVIFRHHKICLGGVIRGGFSQDTQGVKSHTHVVLRYSPSGNSNYMHNFTFPGVQFRTTQRSVLVWYELMQDNFNQLTAQTAPNYGGARLKLIIKLEKVGTHSNKPCCCS
ncbi:hypothetical protein ILYODFUR_010656 [Ilyodon furcidens]|uniref:Uncharacterized protein n=1 Tax=Ilyodon furcidens TaxID=33524 RepID=A0ABV0TTK1_9TELE